VTPLATLPMYDWPEVAAATDRLWSAIRDALVGEGVAAPAALVRPDDPMAAWTDPGLVLGQTCGLPLVRALAGRVTLLGALDCAVPGCPPGWYRSAVVVRADDPRATLAGFRGARLAISARDSQSGYAALWHHAAPLAEAGRFFAAVTVTGAHAASVAAVADGTADLAAIDWVSWRLARRFRPGAALRLRVLMRTDPTPGLPLIAAAGTNPAPHRRALAAALAAPDPVLAETLGLAGFVALDPAAYALVADRIATAEARLAPGSAAPA
jgi:ABC-type phosphate/phosphonate transport system substrate-binding protein